MWLPVESETFKGSCSYIVQDEITKAIDTNSLFEIPI